MRPRWMPRRVYRPLRNLVLLPIAIVIMICAWLWEPNP